MIWIAIAGGSGSGKTTFSKKIAAQVGSKHLTLIHQDAYYKALPPAHLKTGNFQNFDHPDAFDWDLLLTHLKALRENKSIQAPTYDYIHSRRSPTAHTLEPRPYMILEGIFALWHPEIRKFFSFLVYLDVDADIRIIRRLHRDLKERGRNLENIIQQYYKIVRPMHRAHIAPTRQYADLIVGEETQKAAQLISEYILKNVSTPSLS